jgi:hypothetical protein
MEELTVSRHVDAPPDAVRAAMGDLAWFMRAAEFTDVTVDADGEARSAPDRRAAPGDVVTVENRVGFATLSLTVEVVEDEEAALCYEQREGIFEEMTTRYLVEPDGEGAEVTAFTEFSLGRGVVGSALDATLVSRQRRSELVAQLDALQSRLADDTGPT